MYPISLDLAVTRIALIGNGGAALRRLKQLDADGAQHVIIFADAPSPALARAAGSRLRVSLPVSEDLAAAQVIMIAGTDAEIAQQISSAAHTLGKLVNVEDVKPLCDFHFSSFFRRGDLMISVSTAGKSPTLAKLIRQQLETIFGEEWAGRLEKIAKKRDRLRLRRSQDDDERRGEQATTAMRRKITGGKVA